MKRRIRAVSLLAAVLLAAPAHAGDGALEISQGCAQAGCFPGDAAGFPVTLANPGSYRLTSNLVLPDENTTGILVQADHVSIDLGGFVVRGVTTCTSPPGCAPTGSGRGIGIDAAVSPVPRGLSVANGVVAGIASNGIEVGPGARVHDVRLLQIADTALAGSDQSGVSVSRTQVALAFYGIWVGPDCRVSRNTVVDGCQGILAGADCAISENVVDNMNCTSIEASSGVLRGNAVGQSNGFVYTFGELLFQHNALREEGASLNAQSAYRENVVSGTGVTINGGINLFSNACNGNTTCP